MKNSKEKEVKRNNLGITLIALVITIIILLILAGVTISMTVGQNGILAHAGSAVIEHGKGSAREKLEITFGGAKIEKASNPAYNQDDYLDKIMTKEIKDIKILDNVVIVDGYAFEIDRSVPKVGRYVGQEEDLIIPNVTVSDAELINDDKQAKFTITAQEEKKGIKKIEVWLDGKKIDEHDENYSNVTTQITKECTVSKNGIYTVKVYGDLTLSKTVEVKGIISSVSFEPNGDTTYKKAHTTKIAIEGSTESIASIKYIWIKDDGVNEPTEDKFTETCASDGIITGSGYTGTYYLWVLLETVTGNKNMCASEAFNFDNEGPTVNLTSTPVSETSFTLTATASDNYSEIADYKFYISGNEYVPQSVSEEGVVIYTWNGLEMIDGVQAKVVVFDSAGNIGDDTIYDARTQMHTWDTYDVIKEKRYVERVSTEVWETNYPSSWSYSFPTVYSQKSLDTKTGIYSLGGGYIKTTLLDSSDINGNSAKGYYYSPDSGRNVYYFINFIKKWSDGNYSWASWNVCHYYGEEIEDIRQGNTKKETIRDKNENLYPKDGCEEDIWYKYVGLS